MARRKKWKQKPWVLQVAIYLAIRSVVAVFQAVSHELACALLAGLAWIAYTVDRRHRLIARENVRQAFPGRYSDSELNALVYASYRHFFTLLVEITQMPRKVHRHNVGFHLDLGPAEPTILPLLRSERPLLIVTAHFGNWELAGYGLGARGFQSYAVARPLDNRFLDAYLQTIREHMGQRVLAKKELAHIQTALAGGGKIAVVADQYSGPRGQMVNFFGRPAAASKGIAILALQHGAPLMVVGVRKVAEPMRYQAVLEDIIYPEEYQGYRAEAVRQITERYTAALERVIRSAPEQYLWLHNRWKPHRRAPRNVAAKPPLAA